jgi:chemotaxis family two-component system response regulator PixG
MSSVQVAPNPSVNAQNGVGVQSQGRTMVKGQGDLEHILQQVTSTRFTGRLDMQGPSGVVSSLYLCLGRLVWQAGGYDSYQRWRRMLSQYCLSVDAIELESIAPKGSRIREYSLLSGLLQRQQINRTQMISLIEECLGEVLFDIIQDVESRHLPGLAAEPLTYTLNQQEAVEAPLTLIRADQALEKAKANWEVWQKAGLTAISPNLVPVIRRPELLQQQTLPKNYELLIALVNGQRSLRSLAVKMQQDLLTLAHSLHNHMATGIIALVDPQDVVAMPPEEPTTEISLQPIALPLPPVPVPAARKTKGVAPLVVCIDDSPSVCKSLEKLLTQAGYRFLGIQDSLQAIPTLLKNKPALVFLDLIMPVANGYEICSQIRRISSLKDVPVVILTGNDGIVDRVRAKVVGSSDFLAKPVEQDKVMAVLQRYAPVA